MPAYVDENGKVVCFFKPASKFDARYATLGFNDVAQLDAGDIWPTEYAVTSMSATASKTVESLVWKATGSASESPAVRPGGALAPGRSAGRLLPSARRSR